MRDEGTPATESPLDARRDVERALDRLGEIMDRAPFTHGRTIAELVNGWLLSGYAAEGFVAGLSPIAIELLTQGMVDRRDAIAMQSALEGLDR